MLDERLTRRRLLTIGGAAIGSAFVACQEPKPAEPIATTIGANATATATARSALSGPLNVRDFGAKGDGVADDSRAINATIEAAIAKGPGAAVFLPAGRYLLATAIQASGQSIYTKAAAGINLAQVGFGIRAHIVVRGASGLSIAGEAGTLLAMRDPTASGIFLERCTNTVVRQVAIDYDPLPFTQGTIIAVDGAAKTFDFKLDPGYLDPTVGFLGESLAVNPGFGLVYTPDGVLKAVSNANGVVPLASITRRTADVFRAQSTVAFSGFTSGDRVVWTGRHARGGQGLVLKLCKDSRVEHVTIHSAPILAFLPEDCDGVTFSGCTIDVPPGSGRLLSANADGIHCKSNRRGPLIEDCRFSRNGDDSFTIVQIAQAVLGTPSPSQLIVEFDQYQLFEPGDRIAVIDQTTGLTRAQAAVKDVTIVNYRGARARQILLDAPLSGLVSVDSLGLSTVPPRPLSNDRTTPLNRRPDLVADLDLLGSGFVIRNNIFADHFGAARVYANNGVIENNQFRNFMGTGGLLIGMELLWPEVFDARGVTVRNNTFAGISTAANIFIKSRLGGAGLPQGTGMENQDITIEGNTFTGYGAVQAIRVGNGQKVTIRGNSFGVPATPGITDTGPAVALDLCRDVTVEDNTIAQNGGSSDSVVFSVRTDKASVKVLNNHLVPAVR